MCLQDDSGSCQIGSQHHHNIPGTTEDKLSGTELEEPLIQNFIRLCFLGVLLNLPSSLDGLAYVQTCLPREAIQPGFLQLKSCIWF